MRLSAYLRQHEESQRAFARRAGVPRTVINRAFHRDPVGVSASNAHAIITATQGAVQLVDLLPPGTRRRRAA